MYNSALIWQKVLQNPKKALLLYLKVEYLYPNSQYLFKSREEAAWIVKYSLADYYQAIGYYQRLSALAAEMKLVNEQYLYELADCYFRLENYTQSRIELENLLINNPHGKLRPLALSRIAEMAFLEGDIVVAKNMWIQVISEFPDSIYSTEAMLNMARLEEENQNLEAALQAYKNMKTATQHDMVDSKIQHLQKRITEKYKVIE